MNGNDVMMAEDVSVGADAGREVFALTDEQILGVEPEEVGVTPAEKSLNVSRGPSTAAATAAASARDDRKPDSLKGFNGRANRNGQGEVGESLTPEGVSYTEPPKWLAREMNDPWIGDEARELWEGVQRAQREAAAYREVIGTHEDARALKEIYPGGLAEARSAAERARELAEIDATIFGAPGRGAEELRAGRVQLVERLYAQDPAAFREMVEAGIRLLERTGYSGKVASGEWRVTSGREEQSPNAEAQRNSSALLMGGSAEGERGSGADRLRSFGPAENAGPQDDNTRVVAAYREFEKVANAELERSIGGVIGRALDEALPNLKWAGSPTSGDGAAREGQAPPLQERLQVAVKEELERALRNDSALGEQVARILSGRRFDEAARAQVVRLIDARARQLVPGAVKKVVGSWTAATLGTKSLDAHAEQRTIAATRNAGTRNPQRGDNNRDSARRLPRGRVDYRKWSDEQILEM